MKKCPKLSKTKPVCVCKEVWCVASGQEAVLFVSLRELSEIL